MLPRAVTVAQRKVEEQVEHVSHSLSECPSSGLNIEIRGSDELALFVHRVVLIHEDSNKLRRLKSQNCHYSHTLDSYPRHSALKITDLAPH